MGEGVGGQGEERGAVDEDAPGGGGDLNFQGLADDGFFIGEAGGDVRAGEGMEGVAGCEGGRECWWCGVFGDELFGEGPGEVLPEAAVVSEVVGQKQPEVVAREKKQDAVVTGPASGLAQGFAAGDEHLVETIAAAGDGGVDFELRLVQLGEESCREDSVVAGGGVAE